MTARLKGTVDVDIEGRLVVHRPPDSDLVWWAGAVRLLSAAAEVVAGDTVHLTASRAPVLRRLLASGVAAGSDWCWTSRASEVAAKAEDIARSIRSVVAVPRDSALVPFGGDDLKGVGFIRELRPFQQEAATRMLLGSRGADFSVPGSGKTAVAYAVWSAMRIRGEAHGLVVIAPPSAFEAWSEEARACFAEPWVPSIRVRPDRLSNSDQVIVMNYERLSDVGVLASLRAWMSNRKVLVVFDEAHRAKAGAASQRGAAAADLARAADSTVVLTGTPMPNRESDLEAVFDLVWPGHGQRLVSGDLAHHRDRAFVRVTKADLGLPRMDIRVERVALDPMHRRVYDAMLGAVGDWATGAEATAAEAGKALMRLIAATTNPAAVFDPGAPWSLSEDEVTAELGEILADPTRHLRAAKIVRAAQIVADNRADRRKTLVWSSFVDNVRLISEALSAHNPATVIGATPLDDPSGSVDRVRELHRFRQDPNCWVLVATPQTLGEGISLHRACTDQVHVDRGYAAGTWLQSIDRTHRLGLDPDAQVTCTVIEAEDTIDGRISEVLNSKVAAMATALSDHALRPVADPTIIPGDPVAAVLGDINALRELFALRRGPSSV